MRGKPDYFIMRGFMREFLGKCLPFEMLRGLVSLLKAHLQKIQRQRCWSSTTQFDWQEVQHRNHKKKSILNTLIWTLRLSWLSFLTLGDSFQVVCPPPSWKILHFWGDFHHWKSFMLLNLVLLYFFCVLNPGIARKVSGSSAAVSVFIWAGTGFFFFSVWSQNISSSLAGRKTFLHGCLWKFISNAPSAQQKERDLFSCSRCNFSGVVWFLARRFWMKSYKVLVFGWKNCMREVLWYMKQIEPEFLDRGWRDIFPPPHSFFSP